MLVEIKVPVGKQIRFDHSVSEKLNPYDIRIGENDRQNRRRNWNRRNWDFEWDNNWYYDWSPDTDYYMTAEGRLKEVGIPAEEPTTPETNTDTLRTEQTQNTPLPQEEIRKEVLDAVTTQRREMGGEDPSPTPMPFIPTIF